MIHLYAEHLRNIRTLSIQASLCTVSNTETKARLSADGSILTLSHEGEIASVKLPINLSPNRQSNVTFTIPAVPSRELTFRLQLEEKEGADNGVLSNGRTTESGNVVPWTANSLNLETEVCCMQCSTVIVERGQVRQWKDLPSEGWAEMMDLWHCHKPDEDHEHVHAHSKKGYAASSQLALEENVGMVDAMNFLLLAADCKNIKTTHSDDQAAVLRCSTCDMSLGHVESSTQAYKLRKLRLSLSVGSEYPLISFNAEKWLACLLLDNMESQGVRKFIAHEPDSTFSKALKLWIFTPSLSISTSVRSSTDHIQIVKVLWEDYEGPVDGIEKLSGAALSEGELRLFEGEHSLLRSKLEQSAALMPEGDRTFQEWNVALLERFSYEDIKPP